MYAWINEMPLYAYAYLSVFGSQKFYFLHFIVFCIFIKYPVVLKYTKVSPRNEVHSIKVLLTQRQCLLSSFPVGRLMSFSF